jgi:hypothetical protein
MAWNDDGIIGQGEDAVAQGSHDFLKRASGEIGAADASREQGVAGDQQFFRRKIETDAAFCMAGSVENVRRQAARPQRFAISDTRFDCNFARRGDADPRCLNVEHFQQCIIVLIEQDWGASLRAQPHRSAYVIDVGVGDDDLLHIKLVLADDGENILNIVAWIDDHGFVRDLVADDGAVTLQRADGKDLMDHELIFAQAKTIHHLSRVVTRGVSGALRRRCDLPRRLIRPEAQERRDVAGAIQSVVLFEIEQFDVAPDGDGDDGVADVGEFVSGASTSDARCDQVGVEVAAVRALDGSSRIVFGEEDGLHFATFQRLQDASQAGDTAPVGLGKLQRLTDFHRGAFSDPLIQESAGVIANLFIRDAGNVG